MTDTVISSATREVVIGFERPFVMIGERINPTGRKILAAEMAAGDFSRVEADALAQVEAGAHMLDVNAGIPLADEPAILAQAIQLVQSITDVPLSIDSSIVAALEAGLAVYKGKPLVNSVTGEEERLETVLPLVKKYGAAVVAISNDETGISEDPDVRFAVAKKIVERAADYGIPVSDIVVDPLVMPIGAINQAGVQVMRLLGRLRNELKVNTTCGASNVSFGLPARDGINAAFLTHGDRRRAHLRDHQSAARGDRQGLHGRRRHDGPRPGLRALDQALPRGAGAAGRRRRGGARRKARPAGGARADTGGAPRVRHERGGRTGRLHAVRQARALPARHAAAAGRAHARRRRRLGVRRARAVRALPGAGHGGRVRQARRHLQRRAPVAVRRRPSRTSRAAARWPPGTASPAGAGRGRPRHRRARRAARCTARWCARRPRRAPSRSIRSSGCTTSRCSEPDMHDPSGDLQRLTEALEREWQLTGLECDLQVLQALQAALRKGEWKVTVAVHAGTPASSASGRASTNASTASRSTSARPPSPRTCATLSPARWSPPAALMNPQIRFGEDLMSRVSYSMMNPGGAAADDRGGARRAQCARRRGGARGQGRP